MKKSLLTIISPFYALRASLQAYMRIREASINIDRPAAGGSPFSFHDQITITGCGPTGSLIIRKWFTIKRVSFQI